MVIYGNITLLCTLLMGGKTLSYVTTDSASRADIQSAVNKQTCLSRQSCPERRCICRTKGTTYHELAVSFSIGILVRSIPSCRRRRAFYMILPQQCSNIRCEMSITRNILRVKFR
ncbi:hypothetical protein POJ06DRAFT_18970 [Lipomyces tetrasporus]|uniref:Secreted protein n=1 Tax=Lipomyces tetrasporus TaxID=54092 RepID=A0AAD7QZT6_9ASCO|nr:uncharacterized protein POJ06DRAFT_18970 [Lipomyces tetrasporus]KAJ8104400.1 hypothetical protein POJ06DRAFT_18970 [Lipomyces tetrasporus]